MIWENLIFFFKSAALLPELRYNSSRFIFLVEALYITSWFVWNLTTLRFCFCILLFLNIIYNYFFVRSFFLAKGYFTPILVCFSLLYSWGLQTAYPFVCLVPLAIFFEGNDDLSSYFMLFYEFTVMEKTHKNVRVCVCMIENALLFTICVILIYFGEIYRSIPWTVSMKNILSLNSKEETVNDFCVEIFKSQLLYNNCMEKWTGNFYFLIIISAAADRQNLFFFSSCVFYSVFCAVSSK